MSVYVLQWLPDFYICGFSMFYAPMQRSHLSHIT